MVANLAINPTTIALLGAYHWVMRLGMRIEVSFNHLLKASSYHKTEEEMKAEYQVIVKAQQDPRHFAPIYERYYDAIFVYVNRRVGNYDITAEITSRCFYKCLQNLKKYKYQGVPFSAWLYRIAINEINQFFRQQHTMERSVALTDDHVDLLIEELDRKEPEIDRHVLISVLLEQLNPQEIQFLELRFFENRSFKEMGYLLGLTEINAKIKTYRIIKKLQKLSKEIKYHES